MLASELLSTDAANDNATAAPRKRGVTKVNAISAKSREPENEGTTLAIVRREAADLDTGGPELTGTIVALPVGFDLYIDCYPVKGNGEPVTMLADYLAPLMARAAAVFSKPSVRLVKWGEGKGALEALIRECPPTGAVIASNREMGELAIETLMPLARSVVQALR